MLGFPAQAQQPSPSEPSGFSLRVKPSIAPCLNLRQHPSTSSTIVDCLPGGTVVTEVRTVPGWIKVLLADGRQGWAADSFLEDRGADAADASLVTPPSPLPRSRQDDPPGASGKGLGEFDHRVKASVTNCLNLRQEAEPTARVLECLAPETPVREIYRAAGWMRVQIPDGREGWAAESYLEGRSVGRESSVTEITPSARPGSSQLPSAESLETPLPRPVRSPSLPVTPEEPFDSTSPSQEASRLTRMEAQLAEAQQARNDLTLRFEMMVERNRLLNTDLERTSVALQVSEETRRGLTQELERARQEALASPEAAPIPAQEELALSEIALGELEQQLLVAEERVASLEAQHLESAEKLQLAEQYGRDLARQGQEREDREITEAQLAQQKFRELQVENQRLGETLEQERAERRQLEARLGKAEGVERESQRSLVAAKEASRRQLEELETRNQTLEASAAEALGQRDLLQLQTSHQSALLAACERQDAELVALRSELEAHRQALAESKKMEDTLAGKLTQVDSELKAARRPAEEAPTEAPQVAQVAPSESRPTEGNPSKDGEQQAQELTEQAEAMVRQWARAWSEQRVENYLAYYSDYFVPTGMSREDWVVHRRQRVASPSSITVELVDLEAQLGYSGTASARFLQRYESNTFSDEVQKSLELLWERGGWRITAEKAD
ncbi:MAG: SH3 domain-containing protein [Deltaproteobacteria bacterium]|nr:SH3 domain-containing protein [Deltaproteobacteria bacterium]